MEGEKPIILTLASRTRLLLLPSKMQTAHPLRLLTQPSRGRLRQLLGDVAAVSSLHDRMFHYDTCSSAARAAGARRPGGSRGSWIPLPFSVSSGANRGGRVPPTPRHSARQPKPLSRLVRRLPLVGLAEASAEEAQIRLECDANRFAAPFRGPIDAGSKHRRNAFSATAAEKLRF